MIRKHYASLRAGSRSGSWYWYGSWSRSGSGSGSRSGSWTWSSIWPRYVINANAWSGIESVSGKDNE